ncbi:hypothetical protein OIE66_13200 [Nonomuraea sp. NBC_01738]|uniref:hypothetical protein n=1 Tax=Nonomuraea sp. NBC_01738 TaxID=2976003 RepID=UPI002E15E9BD|nr:hypothetical protein OIE66_13200 [Nonomuraea sp. NBC_01738]
MNATPRTPVARIVAIALVSAAGFAAGVFGMTNTASADTPPPVPTSTPTPTPTASDANTPWG